MLKSCRKLCSKARVRSEARFRSPGPCAIKRLVNQDWKEMRIILLDSRFKKLSFWFLTLIFVMGILTACEGKDLTRSKAESLIVASPQFKSPQTVSLISPMENDPFGLEKASDSEKVEEAKPRYLQRFLQYHPRIAVLNHLGLISIEQSLLREEKAVGTQVPAMWYFSVKARLSEQGRALWKEYGLPAAEDAIPLARREFVSITGIMSQGENRAQADFNWKWSANKIGLAFQENTDEFKALPLEMQKGLRGQTEANRQALTENWSGERKGKASFERFDDGWRISGMTNY